jgi:hypothetical protein
MAEVRGQLRVSPIAYDHLRVFFPEPVSVNQALASTSTYVISGVTEGSVPVEVRSVIGADFGDNDTKTFVDLQITRATLDAVYLLTVTGIQLANQDTLVSQPANLEQAVDGVGMVAKFKSTKTKTDSMVVGLAGMYDTQIDSTLRGVLAAMALEDERVGGQGELSPVPLP